MQVLMTNGTVDFLEKIKQDHPEARIHIMQNGENGLAYYEGNNDDLFAEERTYETVDYVGEMREAGYVVMNNIPVTDEGRPIFEDRFLNRQGKIEEMPGFQAIRVLRPVHGNTYVILTQWEDEKSFQNWKNSQSFAKAHKGNADQKQEQPSYSAGPSYVTAYSMVSTEP
ncbi:antibiotic biosynthesis monooxygenase [Virgibacillus sp. MSP4-1]|uniref:antibiotic biosynthesis monooxygenase family protein n=1 Tax=Virgibacillus sp. MSP4-1 TaxID=2700081 RepID=UPI00039992B5|nr:antibiotic biosynthesis monooxygenase [Virgibacillus sp. MSP4-1]QHS21624.1 antibiotic biosynthesis monooxygenase [Virgibacillus sp. MSP4-1]